MVRSNSQLVEFAQKYQNQWVAFEENTGKILGNSKQLNKLVQNVKKKKVSYTLEKVLPPNSVLVP